MTFPQRKLFVDILSSEERSENEDGNHGWKW
jgi:hypothetical protein